MQGLGWLAAIIVGALAGWVAEKIMKTDHSLLVNIALGIVGALLLNWLLLAVLGSTLGGWIGQLIVGIIGACILIALGRLVRGRA
ncbi:GlsB/YeaQ/YmgE family stress response membrane protein [Aliiroseovarius sp. PTFE2010]|uniref:GlsB/YeaQ/YmgE family stress response membrane protein n=1 Tax=Aliiroseovarius sp. PTFE2010 TaxID=3417190 RepID=UPI003CE6B81B